MVNVKAVTPSSDNSGDVNEGDRGYTHPLFTVIPKNSKIGRIIAWWAALAYVYKQGKTVFNWIKARQEAREKFTVGISSWEQAELYSMMFQWIGENLSDDQQLDNYVLVTGYHARRYRVQKASAGKNVLKMSIGGVPVRIHFNEQETKEGKETVVKLRRDLVIKCQSQEEVDIVTEEISRLWHNWNDHDTFEDSSSESSSTASKRPYYTWIGTHWSTKRFYARSQDSVILKEGQNESLFGDIERFLALKDEYARVNIPWHRGYLFYGPPGTGKTSLALAVASRFDVPVYSLSLSALENDKDLLKAISNWDEEEAVLILEDIDVASATHSREVASDKKSKVSLDTLLNVLDGAGTPSGLITIMTTNYLDRLDDALVRPGRVDYNLLVDQLDDYQLKKMAEWYTGMSGFDLPKINSNFITPADIIGVIKDYIGHPELCLAEIRSFVESKNNDG